MARSRTIAYLALLATAVIWGAAGPVIKFTLGGIDALLFLTYRFALSALVALATIPWGGLKLPKNNKIRALTILYGFITSTVALGLLFLGLEKTTVLDMTLLAIAGPLLIVAAGAVFFHEHVPPRERIGIAIALTGMGLTVLEPVLKNGSALGQLQGNVLILLSLLAGTASAVLVKDLAKAGVSALVLTNVSFLVGFFTILPLPVLGGGLPGLVTTVQNLELPYHLGVIFMALFSGNLAYSLWARAHRSIEVGEAAIFSYLYPLFAAPLAVFWLGEKITGSFVLGAVIITIGVFTAEYRSSRRKKV